MKALSIRQPWVWAILNLGKDIENRDWKPANPGMRFRGPLLLHAAAGMTHDEYEDFCDLVAAIDKTDTVIPGFGQFQRGGIAGSARIVDIVREHRSPWFFGNVGLVLADVQPTTFVPWKGMLGFFEVPDHIVAEAVGP